jgi:hypothetical protein
MGDDLPFEVADAYSCVGRHGSEADIRVVVAPR